MPHGWVHDEGVADNESYRPFKIFPDARFNFSCINFYLFVRAFHPYLMIVRCARKYFNRFWLETARSTLPDHDHISSSAPSLDGKGGTDSAVKVGKSTKRTGPSHGAPYSENSTGFNDIITHAVYYRLYTELGPFKSNHPLYYHGRFIGRIPSKSFAPPHTVASIKWSLCKLEGLSEPDKARLFISLSSPAPGEDSARLSLYAPSGPGLSEHDPLVLVVESEKRTKEVSQAEKPPEDSEDTDVPYGKSCRRLLPK
jgi:hypothetical protein